MSVNGLFNKKVSIKRRENSSRNDYGEIVWTERWKGKDIPCARQIGRGLNMRSEIDEKKPGTHSKALVKYWFDIGTNIQEGDIIKYNDSESEHVINVRDAAGRGNHLEVITEQVQPVGEADQRDG